MYTPKKLIEMVLNQYTWENSYNFERIQLFHSKIFLKFSQEILMYDLYGHVKLKMG